MMNGSLIMDTVTDDPAVFLAMMKEIVSKQLRQHNSNNKYDKVTFIFRSWSKADTFVKWIKLADYQVEHYLDHHHIYHPQVELESLVTSIGVAHSLFSASTLKLYGDQTGWQFDRDNVSLQNLNLMFHSAFMSKVMILFPVTDDLIFTLQVGLTAKDHASRCNIYDIVNDAIPVNIALESGFPEDVWR